MSRRVMVRRPVAVEESGSELAILAASMGAGDWEELTGITGMTAALRNTGGATDCAIPFCAAFPWDSVNGRMYVLSSDHGLTEGNESTIYRFTYYDEASHSFVVLPQPPWVNFDAPSTYTDAHGYCHSLFDNDRNLLYRRPFNSTDIHVWNPVTEDWDEDGVITDPQTIQASAGMCMLPEMSPGVLFSQIANTAYTRNQNTGIWTQRGSSLGMNNTWHWAARDKVGARAIFGNNDSGNLVKRMSSSGTITAMNSLNSAGLSIYDGGGHAGWAGSYSVCPVSGAGLLFPPRGEGGGRSYFKIHNITDDTWSNGPAPPSAYTHGPWVPCQIEPYGVTAYVSMPESVGGQGRIFLYKHA